MIQSGRIAYLLTTSTLIINMALPAVAANTQLYGGTSKNTTQSSATKKFFQTHPKVRSATVGAGVGVAAGAVTGLVTGKGVGRGALIGAGAGAGVGAINSSETLKRHPIVKTVATGTVAGLGLGLASSRGYNKSKKVGQLTAAGAAVGLGAALLKDKLR
ncbi:MAG: hypothetical protein K2Y22_11645 [Candidatus Obscuribacterales bacterium]|nr:hypothetical protein [Candidatus Obscuribacterales bacterium]